MQIRTANGVGIQDRHRLWSLWHQCPLAEKVDWGEIADPKVGRYGAALTLSAPALRSQIHNQTELLDLLAFYSHILLASPHFRQSGGLANDFEDAHLTTRHFAPHEYCAIWRSGTKDTDGRWVGADFLTGRYTGHP